MTLSIKNPEADRLARRLAEATGESLTDAVIRALRDRLERIQGRRLAAGLSDEIARMQERIAGLPHLDDRSDDEIVGYDDRGVPR
ncbi:MAG: type II toxin-antitoxin system VapB family antitoxin [Gemmatimonadota bacterium]